MHAIVMFFIHQVGSFTFQLFAREKSVAFVKFVPWGMMVFLSVLALKLAVVTSISQYVDTLMESNTTMSVNFAKRSALLLKP